MTPCSDSCKPCPHFQFIEENLGPTLEAAGYGDVMLMIGDDQRLVVPKWSRGILNRDPCHVNKTN